VFVRKSDVRVAVVLRSREGDAGQAGAILIHWLVRVGCVETVALRDETLSTLDGFAITQSVEKGFDGYELLCSMAGRGGGVPNLRCLFAVCRGVFTIIARVRAITRGEVAVGAGPDAVDRGLGVATVVSQAGAAVAVGCVYVAVECRRVSGRGARIQLCGQLVEFVGQFVARVCERLIGVIQSGAQLGYLIARHDWDV